MAPTSILEKIKKSNKVIQHKKTLIADFSFDIGLCFLIENLMFLDSKLDFDEHIKGDFDKSIGLICKLRNFLPRPSLLQIYKSFVTPQLDYGDIIYDKAFIVSFQKKLETIQYNADLAITGAIRGTSREKVYSELGLESLQDRRW